VAFSAYLLADSGASSELPQAPSATVSALSDPDHDSLPGSEREQTPASHFLTGDSSSKENPLLPASTPIFTVKPPSEKIQWKPAFLQTLELVVFEHAWRAAFDPGMRYLIAHKPFWHDYGVSLTDYQMQNWSDGDNFLVNDIGHPMEGALYGRVLLQNDPKSFVEIGSSKRYWSSRLKALAWATAWSTEFEIGPLSETSLGNQGGFYYSIGCGTYKSCLTTPPYSNGVHNHTGLGGITNNTGWTDFVLTPTVGLGWILAEDTIDRFLVTPIAREHRILGGRVLRSALEPTRSFAALFAGKFPWMLPAPENNFVVNQRPKPIRIKDPNQPPPQHFELGTQYTMINLPVLSTHCAAGVACRQNLSALGTTFNYNFSGSFGFDSSLNYIPAQQGTQAMMQGLFGVRVGPRFEHLGVFGKVRPGFIYYENAMPGGGNPNPTSLTRFVWDFGGIVEVYPRRESRSTLRFDFGTTLVRYLTDRNDTRFTEIGGVISNQYYTNQGNFQFSTGYVYRF
jgi:hypothetical protein